MSLPFTADRTPLALAPMAAISDLPFRRICLELGADWAPTELLSAEGLWRQQKKTLTYLRHDESAERPFVVQIFGHRPEIMAEAARAAVDFGAGVIDVNMGCPAAKVVKSGSGAALMKTPDEAARIVEAVRAAVPDGVPVTVKFRSGWDQDSINAVPFARLMESAGAAALAVHARTRAQAYSGKADWSVIAAVKAAVKIPVIGNGDVTCGNDMRRMLAETGCDGVMIGRGAMGNPWVFRECRGGPLPTRSERGALIRRHLLEHLAFSGMSELNGIHAFRTQLACYAKGLNGAAEFRRKVMRIDTLPELLDQIDAFFDDAADEAREARKESGEAERQHSVGQTAAPTAEKTPVNASNGGHPSFGHEEVNDAAARGAGDAAACGDLCGKTSFPQPPPHLGDETDCASLELEPAHPEDDAFMDEALAEADLAAAEGEIPIGAVAVLGGKVIARAHNRRESDRDPTAHAELLAIRRAAEAIGAWRLTGVTIYVTLEPCSMCAGALVLSRVDRVVYGTADAKAGAAGSLMNLLQDSRLNHRARLTVGVRAEQCREKIRNFFRALRQKMC